MNLFYSKSLSVKVMNNQFIIEKLHELHADIPRLRELHPKSNEDEFSRWKESVAFYILVALDNNETHPVYLRLDKLLSEGQNNVNAFRRQYLRPTELKGVESILENVISLLENKNMVNPASSSTNKQMEILTNIFQNFYRFANQLQDRQKNADPIIIEDEYVLQDFVHAILRLHFNLVEKEFPLPTYCGKASRIDFYLKEERIGIEVKFASKNLMEDKLRKQLIEDKEQYMKSGFFDEIVFFVYNPQMALNKPEVLNDIEEHTKGCVVRVIVAPTA